MIMASTRSLREKDIHHLSHLQRVFDLLPGLHQVGTERDRASNRQLFFDDYCKLVLLYVWNPLIDSIRMLQEAVQLDNVARTLGIKRFSLGSFSESVRLFEPERLRPVIEELAGQLPALGVDPRLKQVKHTLTLVDSTVLRGLGRIVRFACGQDGRISRLKDGQVAWGWRLHTQFDLARFSPSTIQRSGARNGGSGRESNMLRASLKPGHCYVGDGGFDDRSLFDHIVQGGSSYVIRIRENRVFVAVEERLLSHQALDAGVVRDALIRLEGAGDDECGQTLRLVAVQVRPHPRRTRQGVISSDLILLATSLVDLPAELVALIYLHRYTIELFFRTFKQLLGLRHLLSQRPQGIDTQVCCTVIVCLLICLITGKKPSKSNRNMIGWYLIGLASQQELIDHLNRPDNTGIKLKAKDALWKKLGY
jgi:hypothetical protein